MILFKNEAQLREQQLRDEVRKTVEEELAAKKQVEEPTETEPSEFATSVSPTLPRNIQEGDGSSSDGSPRHNSVRNLGAILDDIMENLEGINFKPETIEDNSAMAKSTAIAVPTLSQKDLPPQLLEESASDEESDDDFDGELL
jgi:hypothetical protein